MSDNVVQLPGTERNVVPITIAEKIPVREILEHWYNESDEIDTIFIIMKDNDGNLILACSEPRIEDALVDVKLAERKLVDMLYE